jgi:hypothetical protein
VAADTGAVWLPPRPAGPVVVVAGSVVEGTSLVVGSSVVVGSTVLVGAVVVGAVVEGSTVVVGSVVLGCAVVGGVVTVGWVVARNVESAWVVVPPAAAGVRAADGGVVATGPLRGNGAVSGLVDGRSEVGGTGVPVAADAGAGGVGEVGSASAGARRGRGG